MRALLIRKPKPRWLLLGFIVSQVLGCANTVDESAATRIRLGEPERIVSPSEYQIHIEDRSLSVEEVPVEVSPEPIVGLHATKTTTLTTRTPRTEEDYHSVLPYSPLREGVEFVSWPVYLLWAIPTWSWDQWFAMLNPALNSESMWKGSHVERVTDVRSIESQVEVKSETDRIEASIDASLDDLSPLRVAVSGDATDTEFNLVDLLTARSFAAPRLLHARMPIEGRDEEAISTLAIPSPLGERLFRAQPFLLDPASGRSAPDDLAAAVLGLSELGFRERGSALRSSSSLIFGTEVMNQAIAAQYIAISTEQKREGSWPDALENVAAARALDPRDHEAWDQLEADLLERQALGQLGAGEYDLARAGLLKATAVDSSRQARLAPYITMSIEASDRAEDRKAAQVSREAFLIFERERREAEAAVARSTPSRPAPGGAAASGSPTSARRE